MSTDDSKLDVALANRPTPATPPAPAQSKHHKMKLSDKFNIAIATVALIVSIATAAGEWLHHHHEAKEMENKNISAAFNLGRALGTIAAYAKSAERHADMPDDLRIGIEESKHWSVAAQGYAGLFRIDPAQFIAILASIETAPADDLPKTLSDFHAYIEVSAGKKAVLAYDLGSQVVLFGIGLSDSADFPTAVSSMQSELQQLGIHYSFPDNVTDRAGFRAALKALNERMSLLDE